MFSVKNLRQVNIITKNGNVWKCKCGQTIKVYKNLFRHIKSNKHIDFIDNLPLSQFAPPSPSAEINLIDYLEKIIERQERLIKETDEIIIMSNQILQKYSNSIISIN